jgi:hypothetical protein
MAEILFDKNAGFLLTAYGVFLGALLTYLISIRLRARALERDEAIVRQIEAEHSETRTRRAQPKA